MAAEPASRDRSPKPLSAAALSGRHDPQMRRTAKRSGKERGCWTYIPAEALIQAGFDPDGPAPFYRTVALPRGRSSASRIIVNLYKTQ